MFAQTERTTIILRQIPDGATEVEVQGIFSDLSSEFQPNSVKLEWGDTWFVRMPSEAAAVAAEESLVGKTFKGGPIRARMKSENWIQSLLASSAAAGGSAPASASSPTGGFPGAGAFGMPGAFPGAGFPMTAPTGAAFSGVPASMPAPGGVPTGFGLPMGTSGNFPMNFSMLPPPELGYKGAYISYSQDEIMKIVRHVTMENIKAHRPEGCDAEAHPLAVLAVPDTNLVRRQRSESMDAALAHGRPRFDSVDSVSSVDYRSMMHGAQPPQGAARQGNQAQGGKGQSGAQRRERTGNRARGSGGRTGNREEAAPAPAPAPAPVKRQPLPEFNEKTAPRLGGAKASTPKAAASSSKKGGYAAALLAAKPSGAASAAAPAAGKAAPPSAPAASGTPFMKPPPGAELAPGATPSPQMAAAMATSGAAATSKAPAGAAWGKASAPTAKAAGAPASTDKPAAAAAADSSKASGMSFADILKKKNADAAAAVEAASAPSAAAAQSGTATIRPASTRTGPKQPGQAAGNGKAAGEFRDFRGLLE